MMQILFQVLIKALVKRVKRAAAPIPILDSVD